MTALIFFSAVRRCRTFVAQFLVVGWGGPTIFLGGGALSPGSGSFRAEAESMARSMAGLILAAVPSHHHPSHKLSAHEDNPPAASITEFETGYSPFPESPPDFEVV